MDVLLFFLSFFSILSAVLFVRFFSYFSHGGLSRKNKKQRKNNPPTLPHYSLPFFGHLHLLGQPLHRSLAALSTQHGTLLSLRLGSRPTIVVSSPSLADHCLTKHDVAFADRPRILAGQLQGYNYSNMASAPYGPHWRNLRRIAAIQLLSSHRIRTLFAIPAEEVRCLLKSLFLDWKAGKSVVELKSRLSKVTFNAMMRMIAAEVVDLEESKLFRRLDKLFDELAVSYLGDFLPVLGWLDYGGVAKRMRTLAGEMDEFLQGLVEKQRQKKIVKNDDDRLPSAVDDQGEEMLKSSKKETLIEVLLSLQETDPEYFTDNIIKGFIGVLLGAGTDTSSLTIEWAMALLLNHPQVLKKAKAELEVQLGNDHLLEESDLPNLPYLHCIVNETLRLYPVAPLLLPHQSSEETTVGGFTVPGGTMLLINAWTIHRDPEVWAEPEEFKPERFQNVNIKELGCKFMPFGHGRRVCPGAGLALKVVALGLGCLIQCFDWERVGDAEVDMTEGPGLPMPKAEPLEASYKPCEKMVAILSQL